MDFNSQSYPASHVCITTFRNILICVIDCLGSFSVNATGTNLQTGAFFLPCICFLIQPERAYSCISLKQLKTYWGLEGWVFIEGCYFLWNICCYYLQNSSLWEMQPCTASQQLLEAHLAIFTKAFKLTLALQEQQRKFLFHWFVLLELHICRWVVMKDLFSEKGCSTERNWISNPAWRSFFWNLNWLSNLIPFSHCAAKAELLVERAYWCVIWKFNID